MDRVFRVDLKSGVIGVTFSLPPSLEQFCRAMDEVAGYAQPKDSGGGI